MAVKITSDSTSDLGALFAERGIAVTPLTVLLGEKAGKDGIEVTPEDIYAFFDKTKTTPKTSAVSPEEYRKFFAEQTADGSEVVHFTISSEMSACYANACAAAAEFKGVYVVDSRNLSTGIGLLVLYADDLAKEGKCGAEIKRLVEARRSAVQASFVVDTMTFLYKGGRCSGIAAFVAGVLKIKPSITVSDGKMVVGKKYMGSIDKAIVKYVSDTLARYDRPDLKYVFVTHTSARPEVVETVKREILAVHPSANIIETIAGATVTSHCGKGTLGILYFNDAT
ncbi:MAG TPA: DegV family protein [Candidatus Protoclostridium stercorigallinarum]|uniref:DegV family protein n=1 Tax=Candidatus Protoclostridium stercorigallinarum TaxID=2838741 RepID=A0A9D1PZ04_9FIRM|nr:DegV family protein [Candidatus Protoclostridium stercorigallinarum]